MTITLQDLQVLEEKADANWYLNGPAFTAALLDYYHSGALQRLAELAEDGERYRWLRKHRHWGPYDQHRLEWYLPWLHGTKMTPEEQLDAAIDSARAPSVKEGK